MKIGVPTEFKLYPNRSHTDPIVEEILVGDNFVLEDVVNAVLGMGLSETSNKRVKLTGPAVRARISRKLIEIARFINPF